MAAVMAQIDSAGAPGDPSVAEALVALGDPPRAKAVISGGARGRLHHAWSGSADVDSVVAALVLLQVREVQLAR
jgi:hypothetical protein